MGGGELEEVNFVFYKDSKSKKKIIFFLEGGVGLVGGGGEAGG